MAEGASVCSVLWGELFAITALTSLSSLSESYALQVEKQKKPVRLPAYFGGWRPRSEDMPDAVVAERHLANTAIVELKGLQNYWVCLNAQ